MANLTKLNATQITQALVECVKADRPVFLWGSPGIGKSEVAEEVARILGRPLIDIRLALYDPTDIKGLPYFNPSDNKMHWAPAADMPRDDDESKDAILFLDELNSAPPSVQAAAYQLILNRKIGEYELPENVRIIAAGNLDSDKGVTYRMPTPLANRFVHLEMMVDKESWIEWAINNKVHSSVVGFIQANGGNLHKFDPKSPDKAFPTPRSWTYVSDFLKSGAQGAALRALVSGAVGSGAAAEFDGHLRFTDKLPTPEDVLNGVVKKLDTKEPSAKYSITIALCHLLKETHNYATMEASQRPETYRDFNIDKWYDYMENYFRFMLDNFQTEMCVLGARIALKNYELPIDGIEDLTAFGDFFEQYGELVIKA